ncbi:gliding motility-associated C-terminal domain-containing protein [Chitinophaga sp. Cy-1792]|uniref:gliding motility-associated C-terminal domain-containing protein n=1 Tax=Chitinophaga sp. Cy-1792 TaxID=2608339 RepID=UPI00142479A4|nr:gliding motility-associated C-terminal domain-containing protein [Chitinophaga sp. Cy-1792]NIG53236.1 PKD domain-containing protein [Chitinophaga sp. Cy-1792]
MKRVIFLVLSCCLLYLDAAAYHIIGGEIYYRTIGMSADNLRYRYQITLKLYRDADFTCGDRQGCIDQFENPSVANVYSANGTRVLSSIYLYITSVKPLIDTLKNPCLAPQAQHLEVAFYQATIELPPVAGGYYVSSQRCCRGEKLANILDSEHEGSTYFTVIPGTETRPNNNSAYFNKDTAIVICNAMPFKVSYAAYDEDGDSLTYSLCNALTDGSGTSERNENTPPPYNSTVHYIAPYNGSNPMGGNPAMSIDNQGMITCTPDRPGKYVVTVCVSEYDRVTKKFLGTHSKDILMTIFDCTTKIVASIPSSLKNCSEDPGFTIPMSNASNAGFTASYYWTFGDGTDTLTYSKTVFNHTYPDTGVYKVKLVVNPTLACSDSTTAEVRNYPGLRMDFTSTGFCKGDQIKFEDLSTYEYGEITSRKWTIDTTKLLPQSGPNTTYVFPVASTYVVTLDLATSTGCEGSVSKQIRIYAVTPFAGNDTILIKGKPFTMQGSGGDFYKWSPAIGLSDPNVANPILSSYADTTYYLQVSNAQGCVGYDSVSVKFMAGPDIYVPNAFSPNGDGVNDRFRFIPVGMVTYKYFRIYNRWGQELYASTDFKTGWDGNVGGQPAPVDTYIWILDATDVDGKNIQQKGTVTLIR